MNSPIFPWQGGARRKKALVVISDGNDTSSRTKIGELRSLIRESEVLVYAIGIDASGDDSDYRARPAAAPAPRSTQAAGVPRPSPFPGVKPPPARTPSPPSRPPARPPARTTSSPIDRVNPDALREMTDDSGGRTEIIVSPRDLDPATAGIADELSRQYFLGYQSTLPKDGRWHTIEVRVKRAGTFTVRARRGFIAN